MRITIIILVILSFGSCTQPIQTEDSILALINFVREKNNTELSIFMDGNKLLKKIKRSSHDYANQNIYRIEKLYELNNTIPPNYSGLKDYIKKNNRQSDKDCKIYVNIKNINNDVDYFNSLNKLIKESCISPGSLNQPRYFMQYSIAGNKFRVSKGDTLFIPIKAFPQKTFGDFEYVLFDTLNFTANSEFDGYFNINSTNMDKGKSQQIMKIYGKDIYSKRTENVGKIEFEVEVY